jgi:hypothetical protein
VALGVPVFAAPWDLDGAVELLWHDGSAAADPILAGSQVVCGTQAITPVGVDPTEIAPYGLGFFIDARTGAALAISNRAQCLRALQQFPPGPLYL